MKYDLPYDFILPFEDSERKYAFEKVNADLIVEEAFEVPDFD